MKEIDSVKEFQNLITEYSRFVCLNDCCDVWMPLSKKEVCKVITILKDRNANIEFVDGQIVSVNCEIF